MGVKGSASKGITELGILPLSQAAAISHLGRCLRGHLSPATAHGPVGESALHVHSLLRSASPLQETLGVSKDWETGQVGSSVEGSQSQAKTDSH